MIFPNVMRWLITPNASARKQNQRNSPKFFETTQMKNTNKTKLMATKLNTFLTTLFFAVSSCMSAATSNKNEAANTMKKIERKIDNWNCVEKSITSKSFWAVLPCFWTSCILLRQKAQLPQCFHFRRRVLWRAYRFQKSKDRCHMPQRKLRLGWLKWLLSRQKVWGGSDWKEWCYCLLGNFP